MKVKCYGCGRQYEPTEEETYKHIDHVDYTHMIRRGVEPLQVIGWLEECQRERDMAIRAAPSLDPHVLHAPLS